MGLAEDIQAEAELEELRRVHDRTLRQLSRTKNKIEDLVEAVQQGAHDAVVGFGAIKPVTLPKLGRAASGSPEVGVPDLADWQGAKVTPSYNSQVMVERVNLYWDKAAKITEIHAPSTTRSASATVLFGGDMVEGLFNFPTQPFEIDATIFEQYVRVSSLLVDVVRARSAPTSTSPSSRVGQPRPHRLPP
jgi:hypothetical protein